MKKYGLRRTAILILGAGILLVASAAAAGVEIMPLDQVKVGMKGKGRTVFVGTEIEEFDVEILGVLNNSAPKRNAIIARLRGRNLEQSGVLQGMSGSPVYIDGKLIGAVAFGFPYAKEPIAGITPIGEMLAIAAEKPRTTSPAPAKFPWATRLSLGDLLGIFQERLASPVSFESDGRTARALPMPLFFSGFSSRILDQARPFFDRLGFRLIPSAVSAGSQLAGLSPLAELSVKEGDPLAIQLVAGDLDMSAIGTTTYVDGSRVYAFGHPLYNLGSVEYGMSKASIITVVPALDNSFKLGSVGDPIGTILQDRTAGAYGEIGRVPRLVPVNLTLTPETGPAKEFRYKVAKDTLLTPLLLNMSIAAVLDAEDRALGDLSLELRGDIYLDTTPGQIVDIEDMFSGNLGSAVAGLSGMVTSIVYYLTSNEFQELGIQKIDLQVRSAERPRTASLERVWLDRYEAAPGETIRIKLFIKSLRGESQVEEIPFLTPRLPAGSEFQLVVADTTSMQQVELGQYRAGGIVPRSLEQLVRLLNSLRKSNRVYFKLIGARSGLFLRGEELPNLPPAMKSLFASPRASGSAPAEINVSTLSEYQLPVPYVFQGLAVIPLKIRK